jgi:hypothetical protein
MSLVKINRNKATKIRKKTVFLKIHSWKFMMAGALINSKKTRPILTYCKSCRFLMHRRISQNYKFSFVSRDFFFDT